MLDGYDNQVKQREKNKEEWRQNLMTQIQEQEQLKAEQKHRREQEEYNDEQRLVRQLQEINQSMGNDSFLNRPVGQADIKVVD